MDLILNFVFHRSSCLSSEFVLQYRKQQLFMEKPVCIFILVTILSLSSTTICSLLNETTDQQSLISFKSTIISDPYEILTKNWSANASICSWIGISCSSKHQRVTALNFSGFGFLGTIPPAIGNLSFLNSLDLSYNNFTGFIPHELSKLRRLKLIDFNFNSFTGEIPYGIFNLSSIQDVRISDNNLEGGLPKDMCNRFSKLRGLYLRNNLLSGEIPFDIYKCSELMDLVLSDNHFSGRLPSSIGRLNKLQRLYIGVNNFQGGIPSSLGNLSNLRELHMARSSLTGELPGELGNINLTMIDVSVNGLSGPIPLFIFNISTVEILSLSANRFFGQLPSTVGLSLPKLRELYLSGNQLSGVIPSSLNNASSLTILSMAENSFTGSVPNLGNLRLLKIFELGGNNLTVESPDKELEFLSSLTSCRNLQNIDFSGNQLNGLLPTSIGNFSNAIMLFGASECGIRGSIPVEIGNLTNLMDLYLGINELTGSIPITMGKLKRLTRIYLGLNSLEGLIPSDLCKISNLAELSLRQNNLQGPIPECFSELKSMKVLYLDSNNLETNVPSNLWNFNDLVVLNLSKNNLSGPFPSGIKKFKVITDLDLSYNAFLGDVPGDDIDKAESLVHLSLAHNQFQGPIPQSIGNLKSLEFLDLSFNSFTGFIPKSLEGLIYLKHFNVSYNKLEGEIPAGGNFANFTAESFVKNDGLCGETRFKVPRCGKGVNFVSFIKYIVPSCVTVVVVAVVILVLMRRRKQTKELPNAEASLLQPWRGSSYMKLVRATNNFSESNKLGSGSSSSVYVGTLSDGLCVAIKVFNLQSEQISRSFDTEVEVLRSIRHRNLIKIIGCCCNQELKALVLEYMPNGSLEKWLYSHVHFLDLLQRLNIAIDVALALEYLHLRHTFPIVHCDLKPSNVLLDEEMTAHVGDFGMAKLLGEGELMAQTKTLATIGYMAPEYGAQGIVSTNGDIYSFGIMLLEIFTKKKPTDERFGDEISLKSWVSFCLQEDRLAEVVDNDLLGQENKNFLAKEQCLSSMLCLAMECSAASPSDRISITEVVAKLQKIRTVFLASSRNRQKPMMERVLSSYEVPMMVGGASSHAESLAATLAEHRHPDSIRHIPAKLTSEHFSLYSIVGQYGVVSQRSRIESFCEKR